jgi:hypothetical protein
MEIVVAYFKASLQYLPEECEEKERFLAPVTGSSAVLT